MRPGMGLVSRLARGGAPWVFLLVVACSPILPSGVSPARWAPGAKLFRAADSLGNSLGRELVSRHPVIRVAVADFPDLHGNVTDLGRYLADRLAVGVSRAGPGVSVSERQRLREVVAELELGASDLFEPAAALRLGRMLTVHALVVGTVSDLGTAVEVSVRIVDLEPNTVIASARALIQKDLAVATLLRQPPCEDSLYLALKRRPPAELTPQEFSVFRDRDQACREFRPQGAERFEFGAAVGHYVPLRASLDGLSKTLLVNDSSRHPLEVRALGGTAAGARAALRWSDRLSLEALALSAAGGSGRLMAVSGRLLLRLGPNMSTWLWEPMTSFHVAAGLGVLRIPDDYFFPESHVSNQCYPTLPGKTSATGVLGAGGRVKLAPAFGIRMDVDYYLYPLRMGPYRDGCSTVFSSVTWQTSATLSLGFSVAVGSHR